MSERQKTKSELVNSKVLDVINDLTKDFKTHSEYKSMIQKLISVSGELNKETAKEITGESAE